MLSSGTPAIPPLAFLMTIAASGRAGKGLVIGVPKKSTQENSDAVLLAASVDVAGSFDVFYRRHYRQVLKYVASRTSDTATALDVTAEVFAAAYLGRMAFRPGRGPARAWLFGIAAN